MEECQRILLGKTLCYLEVDNEKHYQERQHVTKQLLINIYMKITININSIENKQIIHLGVHQELCSSECCLGIEMRCIQHLSGLALYQLTPEEKCTQYNAGILIIEFASICIFNYTSNVVRERKNVSTGERIFLFIGNLSQQMQISKMITGKSTVKLYIHF